MSIEEKNNLTDVPTAVGPYSQATIAGDTVYLSGQIAINPELGKLIDGDVVAQAEQVMKNLESVLKGLNLSFANVAKSTILLTDINDFPKINEVYGKALGDCRPARATYAVSALPLGALVEIEMIAYLA